MIRRIKTHNILNGIVFSIVEFLAAALIVAPFAIYYIAFGRFFLAAAALGIVLNCLVVAVLGIRQYRKREQDVGIRRMFNTDVRERVGREHPHLGSDTLVLSITVLLPFVIPISVIGEILLASSPRGEL